MLDFASRRQFLATLAAGLAFPRLMEAKGPKGVPPLSFSTLGCPKWDWSTILENAAKWKFSGIELRGIQGEMDLTKRPEFSPSRIAQSLAELKAKGLKLTDLGSSAHMNESDPTQRTKQMDEGKRFIDLAHALHCPYVRVFGDKYIEGEPRQTGIDRVVAGLKELGEHARTSGVTVLIESHGDFYDSDILKHLMETVNLPSAAVLWDTPHTFLAGHEKPAQTWAALGKYVKHVHLKDSIPKGNERQYVLTGQGEVPIRETVQLLARGGYKGFYNLEWEKTWIPELEEPEVVFPQFAKVMQEYLSAI